MAATRRKLVQDTHIGVRIPTTLHRKILKYSTRRRTSFSEAVRDLLQRALAE